MAKTKMKVQNQTLVDYCDNLAKQGKEIALNWEGGGDSGWVFFTIDGKQDDNELIRKLVDVCYDTLDYGSWAGEFSSNGQAVYNSKTKTFEGIDNYGEDTTETHKCKIEVSVPEAVWFDSLNVDIDDGNVNVEFEIRNGFKDENLVAIKEDLDQSLSDRVREEIDKYSDNDSNYRSLYENFNIQRSEFKQKGDNLVYYITRLDMGTQTVEEKDITVDVRGID